MFIMYFTERPYREVPEEEIIRSRSFFGTPNKFFDHEVGARLYNEYLDEAVYAEELGFDGVMLNEHHGTPFCMGGVMDVEAAILARITKKVRIVLLGNPLPIVKNPVRLAEELATIDLISHGRLVPGWVRGAGSEQVFHNANPAYNREYFNEAHDLVLACWTRPGPFRWEGKHFTYRFVNPWTLPYQKPRPPIWIPGIISGETVAWCAERKYPYIGLGTSLHLTVDLWNLYGKVAADHGYQAGSENFGYLQQIHVADTEDDAQEQGKAALFGGGGANFSRPEWTLPPGYNSKEANRRLFSSQSDYGFLGITAETLQRSREDVSPEERAKRRAERRQGDTRHRLARGEVSIEEAKAKILANYGKAQAGFQIIIGTPKSLLPKLRLIMEVLRPGVLGLFQAQGPLTKEQRLNSMKLMGEEILPELREYAKELGIVDPFERAPGSRPLVAGTQYEPLVDWEALKRAPKRDESIRV